MCVRESLCMMMSTAVSMFCCTSVRCITLDLTAVIASRLCYCVLCNTTLDAWYIIPPHRCRALSADFNYG